MDEIERLHQGQFWLVGQLCFARYEIAVLRGSSHADAYEVAKDTLNMYLEAIEVIDTEDGKELFDHVTFLIDLLIAASRQTGQMN
jgi:hypothetical protein